MANMEIASFNAWEQYNLNANKTEDKKNEKKETENSKSEIKSNDIEMISQNQSVDGSALDALASYNKGALNQVDKSIPMKKTGDYTFGEYDAVDIKEDGNISLTKSKKGHVVAIHIKSGNIEDLIIPETAKANSNILLQDGAGYPIGMLKYDDKGRFTFLQNNKEGAESIAKVYNDPIIGKPPVMEFREAIAAKNVGDYEIGIYDMSKVEYHNDASLIKNDNGVVTAISIKSGNVKDLIIPETAKENSKIKLQDSDGNVIGTLKYDNKGRIVLLENYKENTGLVWNYNFLGDIQPQKIKITPKQGMVSPDGPAYNPDPVSSIIKDSVAETEAKIKVISDNVKKGANNSAAINKATSVAKSLKEGQSLYGGTVVGKATASGNKVTVKIKDANGNIGTATYEYADGGKSFKHVLNIDHEITTRYIDDKGDVVSTGMLLDHVAIDMDSMITYNPEKDKAEKDSKTNISDAKAIANKVKAGANTPAAINKAASVAKSVKEGQSLYGGTVTGKATASGNKVTVKIKDANGNIGTATYEYADGGKSFKHIVKIGNIVTTRYVDANGNVRQTTVQDMKSGTKTVSDYDSNGKINKSVTTNAKDEGYSKTVYYNDNGKKIN